MHYVKIGLNNFQSKNVIRHQLKSLLSNVIKNYSIILEKFKSNTLMLNLEFQLQQKNLKVKF
jgi:hypothetical protein